MTYYRKEDVSPEQHQLRAIGGPIASGLAAIAALPLWLLSRPGSLLRDAFSIAAIANGLIALGSLFPIPFIDGGSLLKWQLVKTGCSPQDADEAVKRTNIGLAVVMAVIGSVFAIRKLLSK
jgi:Zn-dependent protease